MNIPLNFCSKANLCRNHTSALKGKYNMLLGNRVSFHKVQSTEICTTLLEGQYASSSKSKIGTYRTRVILK